MKNFASPLIAVAIAAALGQPAFAQSSPYDAPDASSATAPAGPPGATSSYFAPPAPSAYSAPQAPSGPSAPSYDARSQLSPSNGAWGTVLSSTPVVAQYPVRHQECVDQPGYVRAQPSGIGTLIGAALGGLVGNQFGAGAGRALATGAGVVAGAVAGSNIEAAGAPSVPVTTRNCSYPASVESRIVGFDVVYEYNGQRYNTRTRSDPGARIALDVRPASGVATPEEIVAAANSAPPLPPPGPYGAPYPAPYPPYGYPAPAYYGPPVSIGFGWHGGRWR